MGLARAYLVVSSSSSSTSTLSSWYYCVSTRTRSVAYQVLCRPGCYNISGNARTAFDLRTPLTLRTECPPPPLPHPWCMEKDKGESNNSPRGQENLKFEILPLTSSCTKQTETIKRKNRILFVCRNPDFEKRRFLFENEDSCPLVFFISYFLMKIINGGGEPSSSIRFRATWYPYMYIETKWLKKYSKKRNF